MSYDQRRGYDRGYDRYHGGSYDDEYGRRRQDHYRRRYEDDYGYRRPHRSRRYEERRYRNREKTIYSEEDDLNAAPSQEGGSLDPDVVDEPEEVVLGPPPRPCNIAPNGVTWMLLIPASIILYFLAITAVIDIWVFLNFYFVEDDWRVDLTGRERYFYLLSPSIAMFYAFMGLVNIFCLQRPVGFLLMSILGLGTIVSTATIYILIHHVFVVAEVLLTLEIISFIFFVLLTVWTWVIRPYALKSQEDNPFPNIKHPKAKSAQRPKSDENSETEEAKSEATSDKELNKNLKDDYEDEDEGETISQDVGDKTMQDQNEENEQRERNAELAEE